MGDRDERRYHGLDALRGTMMILGIVLHSAGFYIASPPPTMPVVTDRSTSALMDVLFNLIHAFRMPAFFAMAGFFAALLVEKRGVIGTWINRAARILAPLAVAMVTILPLTVWLVFCFAVEVRYGVHTLAPERALLKRLAEDMVAAGLPRDTVSPAHLWFLFYLLYFTLLVPLLAWAARRLAPRQGVLRRRVTWPLALALLTLWTAATLWPFHAARVHEGFFFLTPHPPSLAYYGSFFVLGYLAKPFEGVLTASARALPALAALGAVLFPVAWWLSSRDGAGHDPGLHLAAALANALGTWALIFAAIGAATRWADRPAPWSLYISQSSYWVFLVHMPFACLGAWALAPLAWPAVAKFALVAAFTTVGCFTTYHYLVQRTWISRFLNGRRFDMPWPWRGQASARPASRAS